MRVLVTGSRSWGPDAMVWAILVNHVLADPEPDERGHPAPPDPPLFPKAPRAEIVVVHGACHVGPDCVDWSFDRMARELGLKTERHPAERHPTEDFGKWPGCGPRRNSFMVRRGADVCIAVHNDIKSSKGTIGCARAAIAAGIPTFLFNGRDPGHRVFLADLT